MLSQTLGIIIKSKLKEVNAWLSITNKYFMNK